MSFEISTLSKPTFRAIEPPNPHSDVDLLVDMDPDRSLLDIVGVDQDLEYPPDRGVDVLTGASLHPGLRDRILAESRPL